MRKYRVKNYGTIGYFVQKRVYIFWWINIMDNEILGTTKYFDTIEDSKIHIGEIEKRENKLKRAEFIGYV